MKYLVLLVFLGSCSRYDLPFASDIFGPKFKAGDCVTYNKRSFFYFRIERDGVIAEHVEKIINIENGEYITEFGQFLGFKIKGTASIDLYDDRRDKVNCPEGF